MTSLDCESLVIGRQPMQTLPIPALSVGLITGILTGGASYLVALE